MEALKPATYADLERLPNNVVGEIVAGTLRTSPRPSPRHAHAASVLMGELSRPWQRGKGGPGGWWILHEPELHLGSDVLVPNLAGWRVDAMPTLPETAFFPTSPGWVCEVISPSTARLDRGDKLEVYARAGVPWAWLVDPLAKLVEVYRLADGRWVRHGVARDEEAAALPPFEAVPLEVRALWVEG